MQYCAYSSIRVPVRFPCRELGTLYSGYLSQTLSRSFGKTQEGKPRMNASHRDGTTEVSLGVLSWYFFSKMRKSWVQGQDWLYFQDG